jgi:hypothetical protein
MRPHDHVPGRVTRDRLRRPQAACFRRLAGRAVRSQ